jgi:hypothetical protein
MENYVNPEELYNEIVESQKQNQLTERAIEILKLMAKLILLKLPPLVVDRDEVISFMLEEVQKHLKNFNPEHQAKPKSAFNYFSQVMKNFLVKKNYKNIYSEINS